MIFFPDQTILADIETYCRKHQLDYIDGILTFCNKNNIELEIIAELIKKDPIFSAKMKIEAENFNFIKKTGGAKLPL